MIHLLLVLFKDFIKKIIHIFLVFFVSVKRLTKFIVISSNSLINLGNNVSYAYSSVFKTAQGGQIKIRNSTELLEGVILNTYGGIINIGSNSSINIYTIIYGNVSIGNKVLIAGGCLISSISDSKKVIKGKGIIIQDNVWIGHGCTILDGVIIGEGAIIAAGSVIEQSVPRYAIYGGVPAKLMRLR